MKNDEKVASGSSQSGGTKKEKKWARRSRKAVYCVIQVIRLVIWFMDRLS